MNNKDRLHLIQEIYREFRRRRRKLPAKSWQFIEELRQEAEGKEAGVIVDFSQDDIREEIQLMDSCPTRIRHIK